MSSSKPIYKSPILSVRENTEGNGYQVSVGIATANFTEEQYEMCSRAETGLELQTILSHEKAGFWKRVVAQGITPDVLGWEMAKAEVRYQENQLEGTFDIISNEGREIECPSGLYALAMSQN